jgi:hypothetical protein
MNTIKLAIAEPCNKNWAAMQPAEQGRFCNSCQKKVIDFTGMDNNELYKTILKNDASICGRFDNTQLQQPIPADAEKKSCWHKYFFSFLVPAFLFTKQAAAQQKTGKVKVSQHAENTVMMGLIAAAPVPKNYKVSGTVKDAATGEIIAGATVQLKDGSNGAITDTAGNFMLAAKTSLQEITVIVSAIGFANTEIEIVVPVDGFVMNNEIISLDKIATLIGDVIVKSTIGERRIGRIAGGLSICVKTNKYQLAQKRFMTTINDSIKIFPNPVRRGSLFSAALKLKKASSCTLQVADAAGMLVMQKQINTASKTSIQNIQCSPQWSSGVYFIRVIGIDKRLVAVSRFVVE